MEVINNGFSYLTTIGKCFSHDSTRMIAPTILIAKALCDGSVEENLDMWTIRRILLATVNWIMF